MLEGNRSENNPADNPEREPPYEGTGAESKLPPIGAPPEPPQAPASTEAPDKEPSKWRENTKLGLEIAGVVILICYTVFTYLQWHQIRRTNDLTQTALDGSKDSLGQTLLKMQSQTDATNRLYGEAQKQTAQATTLATNSGIQAGEAKVTAGAATSAAQTAKDALHVSERAYLVMGKPSLSKPITSFTFPIENIGRIPSGTVEVLVHEVTYTVSTGLLTDAPINASEKHWSEIDVQTVTPGSAEFFVNVGLPGIVTDRIDSGQQMFEIAGTISYSDGFPSTPQSVYKFCLFSQFMSDIKTLHLVPCNPEIIIPRLKQIEEYPANEQKVPTDSPN